MPSQLDSHLEDHTILSARVRDVIIGISDGLTVPFAIAAGLASVNASSSSIIIAAVMAEIAAGSISMGLGGYLATNTEAEHFASEKRREEREVEEIPEIEAQEVVTIFEEFGLSKEHSINVVDSLRQDKKKWVDFMMRFELGLEKPDKRDAVKSAGTIAGAYIVGGLIPLTPYLLIANNVSLAFKVSIGVTVLALIVFGYIRSKVTGQNAIRGVLQTVLVGGVAAGAAFLLAKLVS